MQILALESYSLSLFALPPMLTASTMLALGLNVLRREGGSRVSFSFFIMTLTGAVWLSCYALMFCARSAGVAAAWGHLGHVGITFIPAAVYHFAATALQSYKRHRLRVWLTWTISAAFLLSALASDTLVAGVRLHWWGYYPLYGWMGVLFVGFFFALMAISLREYWSACRTALPGASKFRSRALLAAFCIAYIASVDYLAAFGIPVYPFGYLAVLGFVVIVGHAIRRYRLMSITPELAAREILHAMDDALLIVDNEGVVRVGNDAACRIFSHSEVEIEGVSVAELARGLKAAGDRLAQGMTEGSLRDYECAARDGRMTLSLSSFALRDREGARIGTICMIRDITEARAAERQIDTHTRRQAALYELNLAATSTLELRTVLQALLERLWPLVPGVATTVMLLDPSGRELRKLACRGIDETAWKTAPHRETAVHPALRLKETVEAADIREFPGGGLDYVFFSSRGFRSYLGFPLIAQNRVIGVLSFYSREERRYSDEEKNFLRTLGAQAAVAIHNSMLYEQTRRQAMALEKANRVRDDFLSVMSHELRTPLNVISGYTRLVQEGVMGEVSSEQYKALDKVGRHTNELLFMVSSIMNAAKIEGGALKLDSQEFLLAELVDEIKALYDYPRGKDVALEWDYPGDLPSMHSDRDKLKHVVQNLINNALKFTDTGKVTVTARESRDQNGVEITVTDSGIGIPAEDLPLIFDRFRQVDSSKTRAHGGVGLGLHIVRTFTELLGGQIKIASTPGQGSAFTITLPRAAPRHAVLDAGSIR
jgi:PAS domain S-box-containing protein